VAPVSRWRHSRSFTVAVTHAAALALAIMQWPAMSAAVLLEM
jgi:hypothetical protein